MWLKNLTPAGLVGYLVTNYGYEKVLKLLDGNVEVGKEQLSAYFLTHDHEITPEQASYLADRSMQVLLVGGQMVVHKVAADRFKTTRNKKDSKRKKERAEAKDVPERRKERTEAQNVPERRKERTEAKDVSERRKERIEAKDVPESKKERIEENNVARKSGGGVVEQGKVESTAIQQTYKDMGSKSEESRHS